ncbi:helix-turn-helix transcriptional regulator [Gandjariella thermophila]|uniref:HTH luxR-type domain-containing protein n=1 Tax=Gandjariella thermophila TaxID=1931992 RepID=A0A4D4JCD6_9PSEU|nr:helix-turn-helix transcriptional regulator [Gandjariella thermophila]GDY32670.1 hypothetical protein GTS_43030 [Gandjariella thermophila]
MARLSARDYERILDLTAEVVTHFDAPAPWQPVLEDLVDRLDGSAAVFSVLHWNSASGQVTTWTPARLARLPLDSLLADNIRRDHPLAKHYATTADRRPLAVTDVIDARAWRRTDTYAVMRAAFGATRHIALPLPTERGRTRAVVVHRRGPDFTRLERDYLERVQRLLVRVDGHLRQLAGWRATLDPSRRLPHALAGAVEHKITPRELAVLTMLAEPFTAETIGRRLGITTRTVYKHTENLYRKLGTTSRLATVRRARQLGLL